MPAYEIPLPIGATSVKIVKNNREYPIDISEDGFTRTSEQGTIPILALCGGDEMYGYCLEGWWKKSWNGFIDGTGGAQPFTAILDGSGVLEFKGESDTPGSNGDGWINGHLPIPLMDGLELTFSLELPIDDTGGTASRDVELHFNLRSDQKAIDDPQPNATSSLLWGIFVDESGLIYYLYGKASGGSYASLFSGSDENNGSGKNSNAADPTWEGTACIVRMVFHDGHAGEESPADDRHIHVYLKHSDTIENAEGEEEYQLSNSPIAINWLGMNTGYPSFELRTQNGSYCDDGSEARIGYLKVDYPDFDLKYDISDANRILEDVCLYDGDPDAGGIRVYDVDHVFSGDAYIRNGLVELWIDELANYGIKFAYWDSADYTALFQYMPFLSNRNDNITVAYPELLKVVKCTPEEVIIDVRMHDDASTDSDVFIDLRIWIKRGSYNLEYINLNQFHRGNYNTAVYDGTAASRRFSYANKDTSEVVYIADDDLNPATQYNTDSLDNYMCQFDPDQEGVIPIIVTTQMPNSLSVDDGSINMYLCNVVDIGTARYIVAYIPFADVDELFIEAEDATNSGSTSTQADAGASDGNVERMASTGNYLTPAGDYIYYRIVAGTDLPEGRYVAIWRVKDSAQVADDFRIYVYNASDSVYRNEENEKVTKTLTSGFLYYMLVFDIYAGDVSGTDNIDIVCEKATGTANNIDVDDIILMPIGNGEDFPQDVAHGLVRQIYHERRLYDR